MIQVIEKEITQAVIVNTFIAKMLFDQLDELEAKECKADPQYKFKFRRQITAKNDRINHLRNESTVFNEIADRMSRKRNLKRLAPRMQRLCDRLEALEQMETRTEWLSVR